MTWSSEHENDLRWFFTQADGDMGLRSAFGGMLAALEASQYSKETARCDAWMAKPKRCHGASDRGPEDLLLAAERERAIRQRLAAVSPRARDTLARQYGGEPCVGDPEERKRLRTSAVTLALLVGCMGPGDPVVHERWLRVAALRSKQHPEAHRAYLAVLRVARQHLATAQEEYCNV